MHIHTPLGLLVFQKSVPLSFKNLNEKRDFPTYHSTQVWCSELLNWFIYYKTLPLFTLLSTSKFLILNNLNSRHQLQNHSLRERVSWLSFIQHLYHKEIIKLPLIKPVVHYNLDFREQRKEKRWYCIGTMPSTAT